MKNQDYIKGRGAQINSYNQFSKLQTVQEHFEGIDGPEEYSTLTEILYEHPKKILNQVKSKDLGDVYSLNPYQGCEHGCIYCYARPTHEYWGYSAGLDFEKKIIVKENAADLLEKEITAKNYQLKTLMFAGNTDIYQPVERKLGITRKLLEVMLKYKHPVGMITKNSLILRDLDILKEMAAYNLLHVSLSITSLDEKVRSLLEPRTASVKSKLKVIETLSHHNIPVNIMMAPIIPAINVSEIPKMAETVASYGAKSIHYTVIRLNGSLGLLFEDWIHKNFPNRANKVLKQIKELHGGKLSDSRPEIRMNGEGNLAKMISQLFKVSRERYGLNKENFQYDFSHFEGYQKPINPQGKLF